MQDFSNLQERCPFLSMGMFNDERYLGIIQNSDQQFIMMYVYNFIPTLELKKKFLEYGEIWWWETNRTLPINLYLREEFKVFKPCLSQFFVKEFTLEFGPKVCLSESIGKKIKKKQIQLVRDMR